MKQVEENKKAILSLNKQVVSRSVVNVNHLFDLSDREITFFRSTLTGVRLLNMLLLCRFRVLS